MRATGSELVGLIRSRGLAGFIVLGALLSYAALSAVGPQDALVIEKDGAVKVTGTLAVVGEVVGKGAVPRGAILMWSGDPKELPQGWVLCDGNNNTPDLRGRFIVGYASNPTPEMTKLGYHEIKKPGGTNYNTGGTNYNTITLKELGDHTHGLTIGEIRAAGNHTHTVRNHSHNWAGSSTTGTGDVQTGRADANPIAGDVVRGRSTDGAITNNPVKTLDNRPPYMVLAYIMYIGK